ncbi:dihydrolipoyl dehydrogenase family protein [Virgibacillus oceani]|uniref:Dihydrolipoyl dehydrogenase n=1 Tax=Virgibacillus oceani TaxID=1479511 RepID=A0A917HRJ7_9BACI|nr:FAD-dependent oxidoreductase [Virgibacillus oceani]GGG88217.1 dihydrolipoyl dehydrogenase [Virgibacillus oceani]
MVVGEFAEQRELVIIGGGPGGYNAAIRAAQLGIQVTLIEKAELGGMCLNKGCIPSKVFTNTAGQLSKIPNLASFGISVGEPNFDYNQLKKYKEKCITQLKKGVKALCGANQIEIVHGKANFIAANRIGVEDGHRFDVYEFQHAIIATGSMPVLPENIPADDRILLADAVYQVDKLPEELIICGSDYIALEAALSFHHMGAAVSIVLNDKEDFPFDTAINRELNRILKKKKINVYRGYDLDEITCTVDGVEIKIIKSENSILLSASHLYMETNYKPTVDLLGIDRLGIDVTVDGFVKTDKEMRTSIGSIFAVGDVTEGTPSALKAIKQGKVAAEIISGINSEADITFLPTVVHSIPPITKVGLTEDEACKLGYNVTTSQFSYSGNSYATITNDKSGVTKIVMDADTNLLLGFHAIGAGAVELISSGVTALEMVGRDEDMRFPFYPHPSYNETILEAVEGLTDSAIHMKPAKRNKPITK